ncbi:MAG: GntR family transcriptional regulator [Desulfobacteraceae bacterium]|nr:GntR family transcriptional regulator [Desulfobacteraceae bacterium]MBC2755798.1 GntR family transcriptional regulator [Desulfobacteraceae bacterium]
MNNTMMALNTKTDPIPMYYKLQQEIKELVENGEWVPGDVIPSSRKISETYNVSMGTVQKAILNLVNENYLYCIQGKGTYVATTNIKQESIRYSRLRLDFEGSDPSFKIKLIDFETVKGIGRVNHLLKVSEDSRLYKIRRIFSQKGNPSIYNISYLPCEKFEDFEKKIVFRLRRMTLWESIEQTYGLPTIKNKELFGLCYADQEVSEELGIQKGDPILSIEMLSYTYKDQPYEYRISYSKPDTKRFYREIS